MRRIGMKGGKRRKSDTSSDADSGENGGSGGAMTTTHNNEEHDGNNVDAVNESPGKATPNRKKSRGRAKRDEETVAASSETKHENENADSQTVETPSTPSEQENGNTPKSASKKRKREKQRASTSHEKNEENDEYEVEKIVAHRTIKGRRQFLVRWKGYGEDSDSWEQEKDLNCSKLIKDFLETEEEKEEEESAEEEAKLSAAKQTKVEKKTKKNSQETEEDKLDEESINNAKPSPAKQAKIEKKTKKSPVKKGRLSKGEKQNQNNDKEEDNNKEEEPKEFEVEKIVEVHFKKNKGREFLIRWKGFAATDDTWEPEENLNCPELIAKFMEKVEKAKTSDLRELRTNPAHTKRYTLTTHETGRRWSRRNVGKQRTTYYQCDE